MVDIAIKKDIALKKEEMEGIREIVDYVIHTTVNKMVSLVLLVEDVVNRAEKAKEGSNAPDIAFIEKDRHNTSSLYNSENLEDVMKGISCFVISCGVNGSLMYFFRTEIYLSHSTIGL